MNSGVYVIRNLETSKVYVGESRRISNRWRVHRRELRLGCHRNAYLQHAWSKYGETSFLFEILEEVPADDPLLRAQRECHWVGVLQANDRDHGYNLTIVLPDAKRDVSPETRLKMRLSHLGKKQSPEAVVKSAAAHRGLKRTAETRAKMSKASKGQKVSDAQRAQLSAIRKGKPLSPEARANMSKAQSGSKRYRLSDQDRMDIVTRYNNGEDRATLAAEYGIRPSYVSMLHTQVGGKV